MGSKADTSLLPNDCTYTLYNLMNESNCKYPVHISEKDVCLSKQEAEFVYTCLEHENRVTPFTSSKEVSFLTDCNCNFISTNEEYDFDDKFEIVHEQEDEVKSPLTEEIPFSDCSPDEINQFFYMTGMANKPKDFIIDRGYDYRTRYSDDPPQVGLEWSILTPHPSYTTHAPESFKENRLFLYGDENRRPQKTLCAPPTVAFPADYCVKRMFYDRFDHTYPEMNIHNSYNETTDIGTTFLGPDDHNPDDRFHLEHSFPMNSAGYAKGTLSDGQEVSCVADTGAMRSIMSRGFFEACPALAKLPRYTPVQEYIVVGNGHKIRVLFTVPVIISLGKHRFEIFTTVNDTYDYQIFVIGIKSLAEMEAVVDTRRGKVSFLNRSAPIFPMDTVIIQPKGKKRIDAYMKFPTALTGMIIVKLTTYCSYVVTAKVAVHKNTLSFEVVNTDDVPLTMPKNVPIGFGDARSLGFYHVSNNKVKDQLGKNYSFTPIHLFQEQMNTISSQVARRFKPVRKNGVVDPYPWLEKDDPRRHMTDEEILEKTIDLSKSTMTVAEKKELMSIVKSHKAAFSLRDEIGECPNLTVKIDIVDDSPFFVCPFPIAEEDKPIMDRQMNRLVELGILSRNTTSHTSLVMLITRKVTRDKCPIVDFRLLNTRIRRRNNANPLLRDIFKMLGKSKCEVLSCVDIKDVYHSIRIDEKSKEFCGILPYFGSQHYRYEVLPMGLGTSPAIWMTYVNFLLDSMPDRDKIIAIMDDLLLHSTRDTHMSLLVNLFETMIKNGLKLSPKKSQLFVKELVYLGTLFSVKKNSLVITPLLTRVDAIKNIPTPHTPKGCKSFCGIMNYLAIFCPELQKLLRPIYELTKKTVKFVWTQEHQKSFDEIKKRLCEYPVLHLPTTTGRYILYSDTSRRHAGSAMWQMQNGKPRLIGYSSKTLPKACLNYSVTELEMFGLSMNLHQWNHLIRKIDFDCATDHLAAVQIMRGKEEPKGHIGTILDKLLEYTFRLYYVKGKDLILADYFSRVPADRRRVDEVMPISFVNLCRDDNIHMFGMTTRRKAMATGVTVPSVHGVNKGVNPHVKPEHQKPRAITVPMVAHRPVPSQPCPVRHDQ